MLSNWALLRGAVDVGDLNCAAAAAVVGDVGGVGVGDLGAADAAAAAAADDDNADDNADGDAAAAASAATPDDDNDAAAAAAAAAGLPSATDTPLPKRSYRNLFTPRMSSKSRRTLTASHGLQYALIFFSKDASGRRKLTKRPSSSTRDF